MSTDSMTEIEHAVLDWGLAERLGGAEAPDLRADVRARLQEERPYSAAQRPASRWLAAAVALLGVGAVIGTGIWSLNDRQERSELQDPQHPAEAPVTVTSLAQIEKLPANTRTVTGIGLRDEAVAGLRRLGELESVTLRATMPSPISPDRPTRPVGTISDVALDHLAKLPNLRRITFTLQDRLTSAGLAELLTRHRGLQHLGFEGMAAPNALIRVLEETDNVTSLAFEQVYGFGESAVRRVLALDRLRALSFRNCLDVDPKWFTNLGNLRRLETLDLGAVGMSRFATVTPPPPLGATDDVCAQLAALPRLKELSLANSFITAKGLAQLADQPIERLDISGCAGLTPAIVPELRRFSRLEWLSVRSSSKLGPEVLAEIRKLSSLRLLRTSAGDERLPADPSDR
ncbi:MAG: hypothetical protein NXI31_21960 [bacterium]|nr:hypothetical protein [bacterium]